MIDSHKLVEAVGCTPHRAAQFGPWIEEVCVAYEINTPLRMAAFLAQVGHESGSFRYSKEIWGPTAAQQRYEGRADLGNTQAGDGRRFCGRGLIQLTGRANYRLFTQRMAQRIGPHAPNFEERPELVEEPKWSAYAAADFWDRLKLNALADTRNFDAITRRINGGLNGKADRDARYKRALSVLLPDQKEAPMPNPFVGAAAMAVLEAAPKLLDIFKGESPVAQRNVEAAKLAVSVAKEAVGADNEQALVERLQSDPSAPELVRKAIQSHWFELSEAGGGGIEGAGRRDLEFQKAGASVFKSPSFIVAVSLVPLAYLIVGAAVGLFGHPLGDDVRAGILSGVISLVLGSLTGYYFGSMTSRNRVQKPE